ncbi:MAG: boxC, partial [Klenkia sp.]|nr:boxC [Klenkia sp.]
PGPGGAGQLLPRRADRMEANLRFAGQETAETKVFGRLTAWQNWIFQRPNAAGPEGALRRYGSGQRADYDRKRV